MRAAMPGAGRRPALQTQKVQKIQKFQNIPCCTSSWMPLESENHHFSSDSSRKWPSRLLSGENLDRSWQWALLCWRMLGSVSEHHSLELGTIPYGRFVCFVEIVESAARRAILPMDFSLLSWWDATYILQIVLIYDGMNLINTLCLLHLMFYWCLAGKASPMSDTFSPKGSLNEDSVRIYCAYRDVVSCSLPAGRL